MYPNQWQLIAENMVLSTSTKPATSIPWPGSSFTSHFAVVEPPSYSRHSNLNGWLPYSLKPYPSSRVSKPCKFQAIWYHGCVCAEGHASARWLICLARFGCVSRCGDGVMTARAEGQV